jgi:hypothetical protein
MQGEREQSQVGRCIGALVHSGTKRSQETEDDESARAGGCFQKGFGRSEEDCMYGTAPRLTNRTEPHRTAGQIADSDSDSNSDGM